MFKEIKRTVARNILLAYTYFNKQFEIYTNASDLQIGPVISQEVKPIALYSIKLTGPQNNYTLTEKKLLSIVKTLKSF